MGGVDNAVHGRVAHIDIVGGHVDFGAENASAVGKFTVAHAFEQVQVLFDRAGPVGAFAAGLGEGAAVLADLVGGEVVDVGLAVLDQLESKLVKLLEIIGGIKLAVFPIIAQPVDIFFDGVDIFDVFFDRVGIIEAQVALAAKGFGGAKIDADSLGVTDMQITIRFWWETGMHVVEAAGAQIFFDGISDEVTGAR